MIGDKRVAPVSGACALTGEAITGYEIHMGRTAGSDAERPFALVDGVTEGARSVDGRIEGTYLHGVFASDSFRRAWLQRMGASGDPEFNYADGVDRALDDLADGVEAAVDIDGLLALAQPTGWTPGAP